MASMYGYYVIDWGYDENSGRIHTGLSPQNVTRPRQARSRPPSDPQSIARMRRKLRFRTRLVLGCLRMTKTLTRAPLDLQDTFRGGN
jgi:hypothetical protein